MLTIAQFKSISRLKIVTNFFEISLASSTAMLYQVTGQLDRTVAGPVGDWPSLARKTLLLRRKG